MYEKPRVNVKVEPRSTFTFTQGKLVIMVSLDKKIGSSVFSLFVCPCFFFVCFFVIVVVFLLIKIIYLIVFTVTLN